MRIRLEDLKNVPAGTANGTAFLKTERCYPNTLEYLVLQFGGTTPIVKSEISRIVVKLGSSSKPVWDLTGAQLNSMNLYEGRPSTATVLVLPFSNPRARTIESQMIGALDTGSTGVRDLTVELTLTRATYVDPTIAAWAEVAPPKLLTPAENALFRAILRTPLSIAGAIARQPQVIATAAAGAALLRRIHFFSASVTSFELKRDGVSYFEDVPLAVNNAVLDELGHDPQASIYTYDAIDDDNESKALPQVKIDEGGAALIPQQFLLTTSGAVADLQTVADVFANLQGL